MRLRFTFLGCAAAAAMALSAARAPAQRVAFPTPVTPAAQVTAPAALPATPAPAISGWDPYADQGLAAPGAPQPVYATPPGYTAAPYTQPPPYAAPGPYAAPPSAPYYAPAPTAPPGTLYPEGPPTLAPAPGPWEPVASWPRFLQAIRASETYMYDNPSPRGMAFNDIETSATFAVPFLSERAPLLLTPGFGLNLWDGPVPDSPTGADLPAQTYSAYLDTGWNPQPSPWFGAELGVRVGVYSDFDTFNTHSIRIMGRGLGVINYSPEMQFKLGVIYLDRNRIKLLPAGGLFIEPDADTRWEIFFPRPKYTHRLTTTGAYQVWWYIQSEYGGGAWTITRQYNGSAVADDFDYNDIRTSIGVEWVPETSSTLLRGFAEVGYAVERELVYRYHPASDTSLHNAVYVSGGISF